MLYSLEKSNFPFIQYINQNTNIEQVAYEHAKTCENYDCEFGMECWRMKGLQYQTNKLKEQNRLTVRI